MFATIEQIILNNVNEGNYKINKILNLLEIENIQLHSKIEALTNGQNSLENINFELKRALELACDEIARIDCPTHPSVSVSSGYRIKFLQQVKDERKK